jgi:predicted AlkP superfamily phosphohydrolase/phosphomutase
MIDMTLKIFGKKKRKACVVGLDGVPCTLLTSLMEKGVMPRTAALVSRGTLRSMTVSLPEISSVSWSTFMTGRNPGEHGIFGFTDLKESSYDLRFPSFRDLKCETIWDLNGKSGGRSVVINQPSTYPAREIPGVLISGFVAIDMGKAVQPKRYLATLAKHRYKIDIDTEKTRGDPERLFAELRALLEARRRIVDELWESDAWSLMEVVVTGTDRLHHFAWDAWEDPSHRYHGDFLDYYAKVDAFIGHVYDRYEREDAGENFFLLSDHGFCGTKNEVYPNTVLEEHGYLKFDQASDPSLAAITGDSKAFALDPARVYIHRKARYPRGSVEDGDVATLKRELADLFASLTDAGGRPVVRRVVDADHVYSGPHAAKGPDMLLIPHNGYDMKGKVGAPSVIGERRLQGMHTWDNAFFFTLRGDLVDLSREMEIVDAPWIVLRSIDASP